MAESIRVTLLWSAAARQVQEHRLDLPAGATLGDALARAVALGAPRDLLDEAGVWGRRQPHAYRLRDNDRVELYRGLLVDPKVARRERFQKQGARSAGLFARRRAGAKQGY